MAAYTLTVSPQLDELIGDLAAKRGEDKGTVLRRALALMAIVSRGADQGASPALVRRDGSIAQRIIIDG